MVSIAACHAVDRSSILLGTAKFIAEYGRGLSAWSHKPRIAGSNPASATILFPMSNLGEGSGLLIREAWFESTMGSQW